MGRKRVVPRPPRTIGEAVETTAKLLRHHAFKGWGLDLALGILLLKSATSRWERYLKATDSSASEVVTPSIVIPQGVNLRALIDCAPNQDILSRLIRTLQLLSEANSDLLLRGRSRLFSIIERHQHSLTGQDKANLDLHFLLAYIDALPCFKVDNEGHHDVEPLRFAIELIESSRLGLSGFPLGFHVQVALGDLISRLIRVNGSPVILDPFSGTGSLLARVSQSNSDVIRQSLAIVHDERAWQLSTMSLALIDGPNRQVIGQPSVPLRAKDITLPVTTPTEITAIVTSMLNFEAALAQSSWPFSSNDPFENPPNEIEWLAAAIDQIDANTGAILAIVPAGVLYREGKEKAVRASLVEKNLVHAVVRLPEWATKGTKGNSMLLMLKRGRESNGVTFVDAAEIASALGADKELTPNVIDEIVRAMAGGAAEHDLAQTFTTKEIAANDHNLNPMRYVSAKPEVEVPSMSALNERNRHLSDEIMELSKIIQNALEKTER